MPRARPRNHDETGRAQPARQPFRHGQSGGGCVAGADQRGHRLLLKREVAAHGEQRRRGVDGAQGRGIIRLAERDEARAEPRGLIPFPQDGVARRHDHSAALALPDQIGQRPQRGGSVAMTLHKGAKSARPDILAADQVQPVELLLVRQARRLHAFLPIRPSVPSRSRAMFSLMLPPQDRGHERQQQRLRRQAESATARQARRRWRSAPRARNSATSERDREPDRDEGEPCRPGHAKQAAEEGRDALAALETEPDRENMAEKGAETGDSAPVSGEKAENSSTAAVALSASSSRVRGGDILAASAQHVGRADIARADRAHVAETGRPGQQQAEGDGAEA